MLLPTLYSRTNTGAIQEWTVEINGGSYRTIHGQVDGKLQTTEWTVCIVTNEGRANQRLPDQQAIFEARAMWQKKLDSGYFESVDDIDNFKFTEPMLAKKYEDRKSKIVFPAYSQPKLDGCLHRETSIELEGVKLSISELYGKWLSSSTEIIPKIKTYNEISGEDEYKNISAVLKNGIDIQENSHSWYKITTECGKELTLTGNHRVWVDNLKCWRRVDELDGSEILKDSI